VTDEDPADFFRFESSVDLRSGKRRRWCGAKRQPQQYETEVLENTIVKIGALLALGFGEAGSAIIAHNMEE
jgi:hypothetical protein